MVDRCGTVNPHAVGGLIIPPEKLAVGRRDPDESLPGELHVLALPLEVDGDGRDIGGSRTTTTTTTPPAAGTTRIATGTTGTGVGSAGHFGLPGRLASQLVERHQ